MGDVVHLRHDTPDRLVEIATEVYETIDRMCLRVGELLWEAREIDRTGFEQWVADQLPFGPDKARRLIAIHLAYRELPPETRDQLPRPWQAMYALRRWAGGRLDEALETGEVGPETTVTQARELSRKWTKDSRGDEGPLPSRYGHLDITAGRLMDGDPNDLDPNVFRALTRWTARRAPGRG